MKKKMKNRMIRFLSMIPFLVVVLEYLSSSIGIINFFRDFPWFE